MSRGLLLHISTEGIIVVMLVSWGRRLQSGLWFRAHPCKIRLCLEHSARVSVCLKYLIDNVVTRTRWTRRQFKHAHMLTYGTKPPTHLISSPKPPAIFLFPPYFSLLHWWPSHTNTNSHTSHARTRPFFFPFSCSFALLSLSCASVNHYQ